MVPQLILSGLQQSQNLGDVAPQLRNIKTELEHQRKQITRSRRRAGVGLLAILGAAIVAWPALDAHLAVRHLDMQSIPTQSWGLLALGAVLLLFRK